MKTIGIIGGLSWQSTIDYYRIINQQENQILGGSTTGEVIIYSVNLEEMLPLVFSGEFELLGEKLGDAAQKLEAAGAQIVLLATNTMHVAAGQIAARIHVPFLHIADALAGEIRARGFTTVGLIGTPGTMSLPFYKDRLREEYGITVITPPQQEHAVIFDIIRSELTFNILREESRRTLLGIMQGLVDAGAQGVILGCTEIPMLIHQEHTSIPVFDTTRIHALAAVELARQA